jgi:hypothetical protein
MVKVALLLPLPLLQALALQSPHSLQMPTQLTGQAAAVQSS